MNELYGTTVLSISTIVKQFCIEQGNENMSHYASNLLRAQNAWEDMLKNTIWSVKLKGLPVCKNKAGEKYVTLPCDLGRMFALSVMDECGNLKPLARNPDMNTYKYDCTPTSCQCGCKGKDTLCGVVEDIQYISEEVHIGKGGNIIAHKETWIKKGADGCLERYIKIPYIEDENFTDGRVPEILYDEVRSTICNLEVNEKNCILPTKRNHDLLQRHCGCQIPSWHKESSCYDEVFPHSDFGYWNWKANAKDTMILKGVTAEVLVLSYQTNGEDPNGDELLIPKYARDALYLGIVYRQRFISPKYNQQEKKAAEVDYDKAKMDLRKFLYPINAEALSEAQTIIPLW